MTVHREAFTGWLVETVVAVNPGAAVIGDTGDVAVVIIIKRNITGRENPSKEQAFAA